VGPDRRGIEFVDRHGDAILDDDGSLDSTDDDDSSYGTATDSDDDYSLDDNNSADDNHINNNPFEDQEAQNPHPDNVVPLAGVYDNEVAHNDNEHTR
jgi:hypothetical protein